MPITPFLNGERFDPEMAKEIEDEYGKIALEGLQKLGFAFEDESTMS